MIKQEYIDKLNAIYLHFGAESQLEKFAEECSELLESIEDYKNLCHREGENDEIADVFIMAAQHVLNNPEMMKIVYEKIDRTIIRIQEKYYE